MRPGAGFPSRFNECFSYVSGLKEAKVCGGYVCVTVIITGNITERGRGEIRSTQGCLKYKQKHYHDLFVGKLNGVRRK